MMTVHSVTAGNGYRYFTEETARRDGIDYYAADGKADTQPGRWVGKGVALLGGDQALAEVVTEEHLRRLFGAGRDPVTDEPLGQAFRRYPTPEKRRQEALRLAEAVVEQDQANGVVVWSELSKTFDRSTVHTVKTELVEAGLIESGRAAHLGIAAIDGRFHGRHSVARLTEGTHAGDVIRRVGEMLFVGEGRQAVAGWDHTFSPPKSFSALWAIADDNLRDRMMRVHEGAWRATMAKFESDVARSRSGANGLAATETVGIAAVAFNHAVSRMGDPQPHTHVVVSSKVKTVDGRWLALDGQPVYAAAVSLSERYQAELEARATAELGVQWKARSDQRQLDPHPIREIDGIPEVLIREWSARRRGMERVAENLETEWFQTHGRAPTALERRQIAQQACLRTRPRKPDGRAYQSQRHEWRATAHTITGQSWHELAATATNLDPVLDSDAEELGDSRVSVEDLAGEVLGELERSRSWWTVRHVEAEVARTLRDHDTPAHLLAARAEAVTEAVMAHHLMVNLERTGDPGLPQELAWPAGGSVFRPADRHLWTSQRTLAAERELLAGVDRLAGPTVDHTRIDQFLTNRALQDTTAVLGPDQAGAVRHLAAGGGQIAVLIGPAGTGKTITLAAYSDLTQQHGGRVIGVAPSATAADVLGRELGIRTATIDQLRAAHDARSRMEAQNPRISAQTAQGWNQRWGIDSDTVVIVDEASLAPTPKLAWIQQQVSTAGAKMVLVGDPSQLAAVEAGGALRMLAARCAHSELHELHRFTHDWEAAATLAVRDGDPAVIATYHHHARISAGLRAEMLETAYSEWTQHGQTGLLLTATNREATALNERARNDRIAAGLVDPITSIELHDHSPASVGDIIVTRRNTTQHEIPSPSRITNGDRWQITHIHSDGDIAVVHLDRPGKPIRLPATYAAEHVELGYASTIHRAQGVTTDQAWAIITPQMDRSLAYVALTRGRESNRILIATDDPVNWDDPTAPALIRDGDTILAQVLARESDDAISATDIAAQTHKDDTSLATLLARYRHGLTLLHDEDTDLEQLLPERWREPLTTDDGWPALAYQLRSLATHDPDGAARRVQAAISTRTFIGANSPSRVLAWRLAPFTAATGSHLPPPPPETDTSELAQWLRRTHHQIMTTAADAEPNAPWRATTPPAVQAQIAMWRAEHEWQHPSEALPEEPPSRRHARREWNALQERTRSPKGVSTTQPLVDHGPNLTL